MDCIKVKRLLSSYIDNELVDEDLLVKIERHLNTCGGCKEELDTLTSVKNLMVKKERIEVKEDFLDSIKNNIKENQAQIIRIRWIPEAGSLARRLIPVPAVIAAVIFFLVFAQVNGLSPVDEYIYAGLSNEEMGVLSGYVDSTDLLTKMIF